MITELFSNVHLQLDDILYTRYSMYLEHDTPNYYNRYKIMHNPSAGIVNYNLWTKITEEENLNKYLTNDNPPIGSTIYLSPKSPLSDKDVRNNYKKVKKIDTGDYNVFAPVSKSGDSCVVARSLLVIPELKIVAASENAAGVNHLFEILAEKLPDVDFTGKECDYYDKYYESIELIWSKYIDDSHIKLIGGELVKPCVSYKNLDLNAENELTVDVLRLVYEQIHGHYMFEKEEVQKALMEMSVLNQHNWREYPGTMSLLFGNILYYEAIVSSIRRCPSQYSKHIVNLVSANTSIKYNGEKDKQLASQLCKDLIGIRDTKFVDPGVLFDKIQHYSIPYSAMKEHFDMITKITPKKYEGKDEVSEL